MTTDDQTTNMAMKRLDAMTRTIAIMAKTLAALATQVEKLTYEIKELQTTDKRQR